MRIFFCNGCNTLATVTIENRQLVVHACKCAMENPVG
jgi:hypothetical protein